MKTADKMIGKIKKRKVIESIFTPFQQSGELVIGSETRSNHKFIGHSFLVLAIFTLLS